MSSSLFTNAAIGGHRSSVKAVASPGEGNHFLSI